MIDFSNVKSIVIPEGEVSVISRGTEILWKLLKLPPEYQEVPYIESTGTQWLNTGETINTITDEIELVFQLIEPKVYKWFFGEHDNNARLGLGSGDGVNKRNVAYGNNTYKVTDAQLYNSKHVFVANQNGVFIDGVKIKDFASFASSSTLYLFNLNLNGGDYAAAAKVWSYKHKRNGTFIRDLVPCYRKNNGKVGMYDLVTEAFFTNAGTGEFYCEKPKYKTELAYLESTGTQYIDTGYVMTTDDFSFEGHLMWTKLNGAANFFFGYRSIQSAVVTGDMRAFFVYGASPAGRLAIRYGKNADSSTSVTKQNTKHKVSFDGSALSVNNATFVTLSGAYTPAKYKNMWLFNCNTTGYYSADITPFVGRIYSFKMWQGATIVRDFIPVLDWDDRPCIYDKVTDELFYNQGEGEFAYSE